MVDLKKNHPGVVFTRTGLKFTRDLSFPEWDELGITLRDVLRASQWWWGDWLAYGEKTYGETYLQAKALSGYEVKTLRNFAWVAKKFEPAVRKDDVKYTHYAYTAGLEKEKALEVLEKARDENWRVQDTLAHARFIQTEARFEKAREQALPAGRYTVIVADPPYGYDKGSVAPEDAPESRYGTMNLLELAAMPVANLAAEDAILFLWAPAPKIAEALSLIESWGFEYRTNAVWAKDRIGLGYYFRQMHEHILVARRGAFPPPKESDRMKSVFHAPRRQHSEKPDELYEQIEKMYPNQKYLELFSRRRRDGWEGWGFQHPEKSLLTRKEGYDAN